MSEPRPTRRDLLKPVQLLGFAFKHLSSMGSAKTAQHSKFFN